MNDLNPRGPKKKKLKFNSNSIISYLAIDLTLIGCGRSSTLNNVK